MVERLPGEGLVAVAVAELKALILAKSPGAQIGSLPDIAKAVGVGVVTIQQAARVLEYEGFLKVRRGNRGGYYGSRPDAAAVSRAIAGFLEVRQSHQREAIQITTLLDCDLLPAAAQSFDEALHAMLRVLAERIDTCDTAEQRLAFEQEMQDIIYRMVDRPLMEMLARVTINQNSMVSHAPLYVGEEGANRWKRERHGIIYAILRRDSGMAKFEAERRRDDVLLRLNAIEIEGP
ncbi:MAG TPA: GntR family transcriptional regulator [Sphingobium sp.]